jgi:hypothetical protein
VVDVGYQKVFKYPLTAPPSTIIFSITSTENNMAVVVAGGFIVAVMIVGGMIEHLFKLGK